MPRGFPGGGGMGGFEIDRYIIASDWQIKDLKNSVRKFAYVSY